VTLVLPCVAEFEPGAGELRLSEITSVSVREHEALHVAQVFRETLRTLSGLDVPAPTLAPGVTDSCLRIEILDGFTGRPTRGVRADGADPNREAYRLRITGHDATVHAGSSEGAHRALTSLLQLAVLGDGIVPCGTIDDAPDFAWRGLSLDVVRTFVPLHEVERVVDMLSFYKFNVLHLHLTDNEAWRLQIHSWPRLTDAVAHGASTDLDRQYYTQAEFRQLVAYAADRGVTIIPEIDVPGHATAAISAYPELGPPGSQAPNLDPASAHTWRFVADVMSEVAAISPAPFIHIGGDEAFGMDDADHAAFVERTRSIVRGLGKRIVGWQEICRAPLGPQDVVQHWIDFDPGADGNADLLATALADHPPEVLEMLIDHFGKAASDIDRMAHQRVPILMSPTGHVYLDRPHGDSSTLPEQRALRSRLGLQVYPPSSLDEIFEWDPRAIGAVHPDAIAGVEAAVWCETVQSMSDLELLILPRLPGVAEKAWSASRSATWSDHRIALGFHAKAWRQAGWSWYHADTVAWAVD